MQRRKVFSINTAGATMLVEDRDGVLMVLKRINVEGWGRDECERAAGMYVALMRKDELLDRLRQGNGDQQHSLSTSSSPFTIRVYSVDMVASFINVLCEYAPNGDLLAIMRERREAFDNETVIRWAHNVALGLIEVHEQGYSHRNVNAKAVFLEEDGCVRLGIPRAECAYLKKFEAASAASGGEDRSHSAGGDSCVLFPPEVVESGIFVGPQSDVWHWGATVRHLLGFRRRDWREGRNGGLVSLVDAALADDPERRPHIAEAIAYIEKLRGIRRDTPPRQQPQDPDNGQYEEEGEQDAAGIKDNGSPQDSRRRQPQQQQQQEHEAHQERQQDRASRRFRRTHTDPMSSNSPNGDEGEPRGTEWSARATMQFDALQELQRRVAAQNADGRRSAAHIRVPIGGSATAATASHRQQSWGAGGGGGGGGGVYSGGSGGDDTQDDATPERGRHRHTQQQHQQQQQQTQAPHQHHHQSRHPQHRSHSSTAAGNQGREPTSPLLGATSGKRVNVASMQHTLRTLPKHQRMDAMRQLSEVQQAQQDERRREQEQRRHVKELERIEAEARHREHVAKIRQIKTSRSGIKETLRRAPQERDPPGIGVMRAEEGVDIFVKNPVTLELPATEPNRAAAAAAARRREAAKQVAADGVVSYVVPQQRAHQETTPQPQRLDPRSARSDSRTDADLAAVTLAMANGDDGGSSPQQSPMHGSPPRPHALTGPHRMPSMPQDSPPRRAEEPRTYRAPTTTGTSQPRTPSPGHSRSGSLAANAEVGMIAIVECNVDVLHDSLVRELGPDLLHRTFSVVEAFARLSAEDRALPFRNKRLVENLSEIIGDERVVAVVLPMFLQLVSLEGVLRAWRDLNGVHD